MKNAASQLKAYYHSIPPAVRRFLIKALVVIVVWKLAYFLILKPTRVLDNPLTDVTAKATVGILSMAYPDSVTWQGITPLNKYDGHSATVFLNGKKAINITDGCNGLELIVLYLGFLLCLPASPKRMIAFALGGTVAIFFLNALRCSGLAWCNINHKQWFNFAHHYGFKIVVYAAIFGLWVWYSKKARV